MSTMTMEPYACVREIDHDYLRTDIFKHCPECGADLVQWQTALREFREEFE